MSIKKPEGINSYDKKKFVIGKTYWTFYTFGNSKSTGFSEYVKVFETSILNETHYSKPDALSFVFDLSKIKLSNTMQHNLPHYLNGYGIASCDFFETEADAKLAHDLHILEFCKDNDLNGEQKDRLYSKLYDNSLIPVSKAEKEAVAWYESLSTKEKKHIKWLNHNYTKF